jgi:hypothetical protein
MMTSPGHLLTMSLLRENRRWKETEWNKLHPGFTHNQPGMLPALYSVSRFADADAPRCHAQIDRGASMKP